MGFRLMYGLPKIAVAMILSVVVGGGVAAGQANSSDATVKKFFDLREQVLDQRGTPAKVEQLLSLFKEGAHYEHPAASVVMTMDDARRGMIAHLREGRDASITITRLLHGTDFTVAETTLRYLLRDDSGHWNKVERNGVAVFEMDGNRITRVDEY